MLIYSDSGVDAYRDMGLCNLYKAEELLPEKLAALQTLIDDDKYPIVVVDAEQMMRGVDYRSDSRGLVLLVAKSFTSKRDAEQGLARVGRFGDVCVRYKVKGCDLVDKIAND